MKKQLLLLTLPLAALAISGCKSSGASQGSTDTNTDTNPGTTINTGGSITTPGGDSGGTPSKATSMEKALSYDYSNVSLSIDTLFNKGQSETYYQEYYMDNYVVTYTPIMASMYGNEYAYEEFYVKDGQSYKWFDQQTKAELVDGHYESVPFGKGGWMQKGYKNADLSIWVGNFYLPYALTMLQPEDFKLTFDNLYYIEDNQKNADFINEVFGWVIYDTEGSAFPIDCAFLLDSETSALKKIFAYFDEAGGNTNDRDCVEIEFYNFGTTSVNGFYETHEAPNADNITHYWEYYGWPHDYQPAYYKSLRLDVASAPNDHVSINGNEVTMDIDKKFGVNLIKNPEKFEAWDLVDEKHATIRYEYDESILAMESSFNYSKEFHSLKAGTTTIKATVLGENDELIASNEITVTVNEAPTQDLSNAIYKFSWIGYADPENPTKLYANNDYGVNLPFDITTSDQSGTRILDSKNSSVFEPGKKLLSFAPGHAVDQDGKPSASTSITFDFDDQQVSEISFEYASFYSGQLGQFLKNLKSFKILTSNNGEDWLTYDATDILKEEVSDDFIKLFDVKFAAASKVKLAFEAYTCGVNGTLSVDNVAFSKDETCHDHNTVSSVPVTGIMISDTTLDVEIEDSATLAYVITPQNATNQNVTWASSDETVATVNNGVVSALKLGTTTITVTTVDGGYSASCVVTVVAKPTIDAKYAGTYFSDDRDATIVLDSTDNTCSFTSASYSCVLTLKSVDNRNMLFVNGDDKLSVNMQTSGLYLGTQNSSKLNGQYLQGTWDFVKQVEATNFSLKVTGATANASGQYPMLKGESVVVTAVNFVPSEANVKNIVWQVVNGTGSGTYDEEYSRFTATQAGTVTLRATLNSSVVKEVTFVVSEPVSVTSIEVTAAGGVTSLICDKTLQLTANVNPSNATDKSVTWTTSNSSVATVSTNGLVQPKTVTENKTVTITATSKSNPSVSGSITLTISPRPSEGVVPAGMVGTWALSGHDFIEAELLIKADGTGTLSSDIGFNYDFAFDHKSGNDYVFLVDFLGTDYELVVTYDGTEITEVSYDDTEGGMYFGDIVVWTEITAA